MQHQAGAETIQGNRSHISDPEEATVIGHSATRRLLAVTGKSPMCNYIFLNRILLIIGSFMDTN